jgi:hypothetical protein
MLVNGVQRWRSGRSCYRPAGETIDPRHYEVGSIVGDALAKAFVTAHHYSGSYPAARERFGLFQAGKLVGVAVFSIPMAGAVLDILPCPREQAVELGRFVLVDQVPSNGESWFVARCFELLRGAGYSGVVSFADPVERRDQAGNVVKRGHIGIIYQGTNGVYTGRSSARTLRLLPDGSVFSDRAASKLRSREKGWRYALEQLVAQGARSPRPEEDLTTWLSEVRATVTTSLRHPGNHRYVWALDRVGKKHLLPHLARRGIQPLPYPKITVAE